MIRDTSSQDIVLDRPPGRRRLIGAAAVVAVVALGAWSLPHARRMLGTGGSVSLDRLGLDDVSRGPFVRDIQAEGRVVAAFSPTLFAPAAGAVTLQVHAGDSVKKGQVLATIASPDLAAKLAQEQSSADTLQTDTLRARVEAGEQRAALQGARENAAIDVKAADTDLERQQKAFDAGAAAGMQVDHARDALEKARIALSHAEAGLHSKDDSLKFDVQSKEQAHARQVLLVDDLKRQVGRAGGALARRWPGRPAVRRRARERRQGRAAADGDRPDPARGADAGRREFRARPRGGHARRDRGQRPDVEGARQRHLAGGRRQPGCRAVAVRRRDARATAPEPAPFGARAARSTPRRAERARRQLHRRIRRPVRLRRARRGGREDAGAPGRAQRRPRRDPVRPEAGRPRRRLWRRELPCRADASACLTESS